MSIIGWIREGDPAACGGKVKEGHSHFMSYGKALAHEGSPMSCKKSCVIKAGAHHFTLPDGQPQALHGDKSSGGCPLITRKTAIVNVPVPWGIAGNEAKRPHLCQT